MVALRCANCVFPASQYSAFKTPHLDYRQIVQIIQCYYRGKTKSPESLRSIATDFDVMAVKPLLNLPNISPLFLMLLILSIARKPVRENPLLSISLLKLTDSFSDKPFLHCLFVFVIGHLFQRGSC